MDLIRVHPQNFSCDPDEAGVFVVVRFLVHLLSIELSAEIFIKDVDSVFVAVFLLILRYVAKWTMQARSGMLLPIILQ